MNSAFKRQKNIEVVKILKHRSSDTQYIVHIIENGVIRSIFIKYYASEGDSSYCFNCSNSLDVKPKMKKFLINFLAFIINERVLKGIYEERKYMCQETYFEPFWSADESK